jgi:hypothetical protein
MHPYEILYRDPKAPSRGQQKLVIQADNAHNAARMFQAQFPHLQLCSQPTRIR